MKKDKFNTLMYALIKEAAKSSFVEFLEVWELTEEDYNEIKTHLEETYGIKMYV